MSKIKVGDLRGLAKNTEYKHIVEVEDFKVGVEQYLPIVDKITLATSAVLSSVNEEGLILRNSLHIASRVLIVRVYSDIRLPKDNMEAYDLLMSSGLYERVESSIPEEELEELKTIINNHVKEIEDEYEREHSVESVLNKSIKEIKDLGYAFLANIPDEHEMGNIKNELNDIDPNNLEFISNFIKASNNAEKGE